MAFGYLLSSRKKMFWKDNGMWHKVPWTPSWFLSYYFFKLKPAWGKMCPRRGGKSRKRLLKIFPLPVSVSNGQSQTTFSPMEAKIQEPLWMQKQEKNGSWYKPVSDLLFVCSSDRSAEMYQSKDSKSSHVLQVIHSSSSSISSVDWLLPTTLKEELSSCVWPENWT